MDSSDKVSNSKNIILDVSMDRSTRTVPVLALETLIAGAGHGVDDLRIGRTVPGRSTAWWHP